MVNLTKINNKKNTFKIKNKTKKKHFTQKGGDIYSDIKKLCSDRKLEKIKELIGVMVGSAENDPFTYNYNPPSRWKESILESPQKVYEWYVSKNPRFLPIVKQNRIELEKMEPKIKGDNGWEPVLDIEPYPEVKVPEYDFLVMGMVKNLLLIHFNNHMPQISHQFGKEINNNNNKKSRKLLQSPLEKKQHDELKRISLEILSHFNKLIIDGYKYTDFLDCLCDYLLFFSIGDLNPVSDRIISYINFIKSLKKTCFLVLPTFEQVNFKKILNLSSAPVLNFRLSNSRVFVHENDQILLFEIAHDIEFHCDLTHSIKNYIPKKKDPFSFISSDDLIYKPSEIAALYSKRLREFNKLYGYYNYNNKNIKGEEYSSGQESNTNNTNNTNNFTDKEKYLLCCLLFYLFHEVGVTDSSDSIINDFNEGFIKEKFMNFIRKLLAGVYNFENMKKNFFLNKAKTHPGFIKHITFDNIKSLVEKFAHYY